MTRHCSRTTVTSHLNRDGVPRHSEQTAWDDRTLKEAAELYVAGRSLADVGEQFGIDAQTVANRFRRAGVAVRPRRGWPSRDHSEHERLSIIGRQIRVDMSRVGADLGRSTERTLCVDGWRASCR